MRKLSLQLLSDAFTVEEGTYGGLVFAVYGSERTLQMVNDFMKAVDPKRWTPSNLWHAQYVLARDMEESVLRLGVIQAFTPEPQDFVDAWKFIPIPEGEAPNPRSHIWARLLDLD